MANGHVDVCFLFLELQRQLCEVLVSFRSTPGFHVISGSFQFRGELIETVQAAYCKSARF